MGEGNPPGKHSESYTVPSEGEASKFTDDSSYKNLGGLDPKSEKSVGNQPTQESGNTLEKFDKEDDPIHQ